MLVKMINLSPFKKIFYCLYFIYFLEYEEEIKIKRKKYDDSML